MHQNSHRTYIDQAHCLAPNSGTFSFNYLDSYGCNYLIKALNSATIKEIRIKDRKYVQIGICVYATELRIRIRDPVLVKSPDPDPISLLNNSILNSLSYNETHFLHVI